MAYFVLMCYGHSISSPLTDFTYKYHPGWDVWLEPADFILMVIWIVMQTREFFQFCHCRRGNSTNFADSPRSCVRILVNVLRRERDVSLAKNIWFLCWSGSWSGSGRFFAECLFYLFIYLFSDCNIIQKIEYNRKKWHNKKQSQGTDRLQ